MTHTYDTKAYNYDDTNPVTVSVTPTTGATVLVLSLIMWSTDARTGGAPSFNGVDLTQAGTVAVGVETSSELWYLINPSIGTYNVSIPNVEENYCFGMVSTYKAQAGYSTEFDATNKASGNSDTPTVSVTTTEDGDVIVDALGTGSADITANNQTLLYNNGHATFSDAAQYALLADAGPIVMQWSTNLIDDWSLVAAAFKEVAPAPTGHPWFYERKQ